MSRKAAERHFGWVPDFKQVDRVLGELPHPLFSVVARPLIGSGEGKTVLLYHALTAANRGVFPIHEQTIGDCVSHGWGLGVDILSAVQAAAAPLKEKWAGESVTEVIYAGSRVEIGGGRLGGGDGSIGAWAAKFVSTFGTLLRGKYGSIDLTRYSGQRAKQWGGPRAGVPDELEPTVREHPVRTVSLIRDYEEARDAIANGYPVPVCSMRGFTSRRDSQGFARASGQWPHCMLFCGVDDTSRPGLLCMNSWGPSWIDGPKRHEQPDGSFWVEASTCSQMLREEDSFAMSGFEGFPARPMPDFSQLDWSQV